MDDITFTELVEHVGVNHDDLVSHIQQHLISLLTWKQTVYKHRLTTSQSQYDELAILIQTEHLKQYQIRKHYPELYINQQLYIRLAWILNRIETILGEMSSTNGLNVMQTRLINLLTNVKLGLGSISKSHEFVRQLLVNKVYSLRHGFHQFTSLFSNMLLLGGAGVGKTSIARTIAYAMGQLGVLVDDRLLEVTTASFIGADTAETATTTLLLLNSALERVVLYDEAYEIGCTPPGDPRSLAVTELVKWMDVNVGLSIIVAAGYEKEMNTCFLTANQGLPRRFVDRIRLNRYSVSDLVHVFVKQVAAKLPHTTHPFSPLELSYWTRWIRHLSEFQSFDILAFQSGDMTNLATYFLRRYYGAFRNRWMDGDVIHNSKIVDQVVMDFLTNKDLSQTNIQQLLDSIHGTLNETKETAISSSRVYCIVHKREKMKFTFQHNNGQHICSVAYTPTPDTTITYSVGHHQWHDMFVKRDTTQLLRLFLMCCDVSRFLYSI